MTNYAPQGYLPAIMYFSVNVSFASLPLFVPTIVSEIGTFTTVQAQGLSAPPYALCFFVILGVCWMTDKFRIKGPFITAAALVAAVGFILLATCKSPVARYIGASLPSKFLFEPRTGPTLPSFQVLANTKKIRRLPRRRSLRLRRHPPLMGLLDPQHRIQTHWRLRHPPSHRAVRSAARHKHLPRQREAVLPQGHVDLHGILSIVGRV